eukprot:gene11872-13104_t
MRDVYKCQISKEGRKLCPLVSCFSYSLLMICLRHFAPMLAIAIQSDVSYLPVGVLAAISFLLCIVILIQCTGKKKSSDSLNDGNFKKVDSYESAMNKGATVVIPVEETQTADQQERGDKSRSSTAKTDKSETINSQENVNESKKDQSVKKGGTVKDGTGSNKKTSNGSANETVKTNTENSGSLETSGDSLYTKVKSVPVKEECAYSVVDVSSRDAEYEIVGGNIKRCEMDGKQKQQKKISNDSDSKYDSIDATPKWKTALDPVLFAIEDSGSSGIYEDVPDSKPHNLKVQLSQSDENAGRTTEFEKSEADKKQSKFLEPKQKKWGLKRFSIKGKKRSESAVEQTELSDGKASPKITGERRPMSMDLAHNFGVGTPPPPPIENLRMKIDQSRTVHHREVGPEPPNHPPLPPTPDHPLSAPRFPVHSTGEHRSANNKPSVQQGGSGNDTQDGEIREDALYEEPDRDVSTGEQEIHFKKPSRNSIQTNLPRSSPPVSASQLPPKDYEGYEVVTSRDRAQLPGCSPARSDSREMSGRSVSELHQGIDITPPPLTDANTAVAVVEGKDEPRYAIVERKSVKSANAKLLRHDAADVDTTKSENEDRKIEVFMKKTQISTKLSKSEATELTTMISLGTAEDGATEAIKSDAAKEENNDEDSKAANVVSDMYAKVDMVKKREEQAKRAMYAAVTKKKTGVKRFYDEEDQEHVMTTEEFEGGHYTRITDDVTDDTLNDGDIIPREETSSNTATTASTPDDNAYETIGYDDKKWSPSSRANGKPYSSAASNRLANSEPETTKKATTLRQNSDYEELS